MHEEDLRQKLGTVCAARRFVMGEAWVQKVLQLKQVSRDVVPGGWTRWPKERTQPSPFAVLPPGLAREIISYHVTLILTLTPTAQAREVRVC